MHCDCRTRHRYRSPSRVHVSIGPSRLHICESITYSIERKCIDHSLAIFLTDNKSRTSDGWTWVKIQTGDRVIEIWNYLAWTLIFDSIFFFLCKCILISIHTIEIEIDLARVFLYGFYISVDEIEFSSFYRESVSEGIDCPYSTYLIAMSTADDGNCWSWYSRVDNDWLWWFHKYYNDKIRIKSAINFEGSIEFTTERGLIPSHFFRRSATVIHRVSSPRVSTRTSSSSIIQFSG